MSKRIDLQSLQSRYSDRSYYVRERHHIDFLEEEGAFLNAQQIDRLSNFAFAMLKPDAVAMGYASAIVDWLEDQDFVVPYLSLQRQPEERDFEQLYQYNITVRNEQNQIASWWMNRRLYTMGPSVLLLIGRKDDCCVYRSLQFAKGASDPSRATEGQLRYEFPACNMTMNLFHCSDDPVSSAREFLIFREPKELIRVLNSLSDPINGIDSSQKAKQISNAYGNKLVIDPATSVRKMILQMSIESNWEHLLPIELTSVSQLDQKPLIDNRIKKLEKDLRSFAAPYLDCGSVCESYSEDLSTLLGFPNVSGAQMQAAIERLRLRGIVIDSWDELAVISTCHNALLASEAARARKMPHS